MIYCEENTEYSTQEFSLNMADTDCYESRLPTMFTINDSLNNKYIREYYNIGIQSDPNFPPKENIKNHNFRYGTFCFVVKE